MDTDVLERPPSAERDRPSPGEAPDYERFQRAEYHPGGLGTEATDEERTMRPKMVVATIPVTDLERSRSFYSGTLGLRVLQENPFSVRLDGGGGSQLSIFRRGPTKVEHTVAHFEVEDIQAAVAELRGKGVVFEEYAEGPTKTTKGIAQLGPNRGAWFRDPDGNFLGLLQEGKAG